MKITVANLPQLHASGRFPVTNGTDEYIHLLFDKHAGLEERVFCTKRDDNTWLVQQTYSSQNEYGFIISVRSDSS